MATPGPPCARCGWILRWFQPQYAWVCDRCHGIFPAAVPGAPAARAALPGARPVSPRPPFTLTRPQLIAVAVGAVVIAGGIAAFVLLRGGGSHGGVARSRDELVRRIVAAMNAHDLDAALGLADYAGLKARTMDCTGDDPDKVEQDAERIRDGFKSEITRTRNVEIELVRINTEIGDGDDHKPLTLDKGDTAGNGCKFTVDVELHTLKFAVKLTADGNSREKDVEMYALVTDGEWHLLSPPSLQGSISAPDCWEAVRNAMARSRDDMLKMPNMTASKLDDVKYAMSELCRTDGWGEDALTCLTDATDQSSVETCMRKLTASQMSAVTDKLVKIVSGGDP
jgi:hypothetical protein